MGDKSKALLKLGEVTFTLRTLTARELFKVERTTRGIKEKHLAAERDAIGAARAALAALDDHLETPDRPLIGADPERIAYGRELTDALFEACVKWDARNERGETPLPDRPELVDVVEVAHDYDVTDLESLADVLRIGIAGWEGPGVPGGVLKTEIVEGCRMIPMEKIDTISVEFWGEIYGEIMAICNETEEQRGN